MKLARPVLENDILGQYGIDVDVEVRLCSELVVSTYAVVLADERSPLKHRHPLVFGQEDGGD